MALYVTSDPLVGADLSTAILAGANLAGADLGEANLSGAALAARGRALHLPGWRIAR